MCIAIWVPGKAITIRFLLEQIWLTTGFKTIYPTEVYDLLIQNDEQEPISELFALFPHWMSQEPGNPREIRCQLPAVSGPDNQWGWYYGPQSNTDSPLRTLYVPEHKSGGMEAMAGIVGDVKAEWPEELSNSKYVTVLEGIKKAVYRIRLDPPIPAMQLPDHKARWIRVVAEPKQLAIDAAPTQQPDEFGRPGDRFHWNLAVTCPSSLMEEVEQTIDRTCKKMPSEASVQQIRRVLVTEGFRRHGTCVTVLDHRVVVGTPIAVGTHIAASEIIPGNCASFDRIKFVGNRTHKFEQQGMPMEFQFSEWSGGARRNDHEDLGLVALKLLDYGRVKRPATNTEQPLCWSIKCAK